jgi:hypothetical protein
VLDFAKLPPAALTSYFQGIANRWLTGMCQDGRPHFIRTGRVTLPQLVRRSGKPWGLRNAFLAHRRRSCVRCPLPTAAQNRKSEHMLM